MASMKIWYGKDKPLTAIGKHQVRLLGFLERFQGWHTMGQDRTTQAAVFGLLRRGSIAYNSATNQACIVYAQSKA